MSIHPTAIIALGASLHDNVDIGPYCVVGENVTLGEGAKLHHHVSVEGRTTIGPYCEIFPFVSLGMVPQDLKYKGEPSYLEIGAHFTAREFVTVNTGTQSGGLYTRIGDHCSLLACSHIGHDCQVGHHVVLSNAVLLGGHCKVASYVVIGGNTAIHQFTQIGKYAFVSGQTGVGADVPPYCVAFGAPAELRGLNVIGLRRAGIQAQSTRELQRLYKRLFRPDGDKETLQERLEKAQEEFKALPEAEILFSFLTEGRSRSLCQDSIYARRFGFEPQF